VTTDDRPDQDTTPSEAETSGRGRNAGATGASDSRTGRASGEPREEPAPVTTGTGNTGPGPGPGTGHEPEAAGPGESTPGSTNGTFGAEPGDEAAEAGDEPANPGGEAAEPGPGTRGTGAEAGCSPFSPSSSDGVFEVATGAGDGEGRSRTAGRRKSSVLAGAVAAAVLVVGGGAVLAASALGGGGGGDSGAAAGGSATPGVLTLDGYQGGSTGGTSGVAPGEPDPYGTAYRASGTLPGGPRSAAVHWARGEVTRNEVARLARALGLDGTPVAEGREWRVGADRGEGGPGLRVSRQAPGAWTFDRYARGFDDCTGDTARCRHDETVLPAVDPVSEAVAKRVAAPVLKVLGQDDSKLDAGQVIGIQRVVNADPVVGELPTHGWATRLRIIPSGEVAGGSGRLGAAERGDSYPVLSAGRTLALLNATVGTGHRMGIGGCADPVPLKDRLEAPCGTTGTASKAPTAPSAGDRRTAVVEDAVFGLAPHSSGGRQVLVPSWLFEVRQPGAQDTSTVTYPAVDPRYLTSSASSAPTGRPSPQPTGSPATRDIAVDGYRADGKELTVSFTGGVCAGYKATATEDSGRVKVTVTETTKPGTVCIMIAKFYEQTVRLDRPLGDRKVVGSDGEAIPLSKPGARVPAPSSSPAR
jgi:hypothetical protein